jgi:predicted metalloprotease with PDZ domain
MPIDKYCFMMKASCLYFLATVLLSFNGYSQNRYQYFIDVNKLDNDGLNVELKTPQVKTATAVFSIPKIIPGTYAIADYGKFISRVKAFDKNGKSLTVKKLNENQWKISNAARLDKISYRVDDIYDAAQKHSIYPMAATNFEEGKNIVLNMPGVFGFIEGLRSLPFQIALQKPSQFYASTSLKPVSASPTSDVFEAPGVDALYDYPIMYSVPDTASVQVGNCSVLVSVYSPNKQVHAKEIAGWMSNLLDAARQYLGGKLPADKYAFIYYFRDPELKHSFPPGLGGALEHTTSSFYYLEEAPAEQLKEGIIDMSSHEFFHIVTPLTIASKEVKEFNFNEAVMSKHLWLYEGVTEYTAHHVQVKYGLNSVREFLDKLSDKITTSRSYYNDSLPFTELSKHSTDKWAPQYGNVYQKGALIAACLDIYLLHLSNGAYGLRNLTYDLGVRFGKYRYFNDEELFDNIAELTYPEVKEFLQKYVAGPTPIPYEYFFGLAGVQFVPKTERQTFSFGNIAMGVNEKGVVVINPPFKPNEFGKKLGYRQGDEIYAFNGIAVTPQNLNEVINQVRSGMKEGDPFTVKIGRRSSNNVTDTVTLSTAVFKVTVTDINKLNPMPDATAKQRLVQKAWLTAAKNGEVKETPPADPSDVASIDAIITATYGVISGPAGPRNWSRFHSLFLPEAQMGSIAMTPAGQANFRSSTPQNYQKANAPFFLKNGFYEEELKRDVMQFGNVATVQSSYQFRFTPDGKVEQRGVNYFTLVRSNGRWWISNLVWQDEEKDLPLPAGLQKK